MHGNVLANLEFQSNMPGIYHFSLTPNFPLTLSNFYTHLLSFPDETALTQVKLFLENLEIIPRLSGKNGISFVRNSKEGLASPGPLSPWLLQDLVIQM